MKIYNSLTRQKSELETLQPGKIGMYVCGMTVYDYCHLGHARVLVAFDVVTRFLRQQGYDLTYVRNITDVDDKIIRRAAENGETVEELTERFIQAMHEDERALGVLRPDLEPRATQHIADIVQMVETLITNGSAYQGASGDVYFAIDSFPDYGKLSGRKLDELEAGHRVEVQESKRNPLDFVLWKPAKPGEVAWPSPWGDGRPGWHIECSAMSESCLGKTFDIHGGGPDLLFPHHENEIAQSEAAHGCEFVKQWMHAGPVRVNKEKMSKSLGNFFTIREVLKQYGPEVVRYFIVSSHYRSPIDYSEDSLREASAALHRFYHALRDVSDVSGISPASELQAKAVIPEGRSQRASEYKQRFDAAMADDFNTPAALAVLFEMVKQINAHRNDDREEAGLLARTIVELASVLGLLQLDPTLFLQGNQQELGISVADIEALIEQRRQARVNKDWAESDRIRDHLLARGIALKDTREGTTWVKSED